jgi:hypothetical protein
VPTNGSACGATGLVPACSAPTAVEPARTAAGAATAPLARPTAAEVFGGVDGRAAVRGAREYALARGAVAEADSDEVDPSDPESASATAGAEATQAPIPNATARAPTRPT